MNHTPHQVEQLDRLERLLEPQAELTLFGPTPTRGELRALPLQWILWGRPALSFPDGEVSNAAVLIADLELVRVLIRRTPSPKQKQQLAIKARRAWARLVELAEGLQVNGARYPSVVLFAS